MNQPTCSCAKFERFEGASVNAYIAAFLEADRQAKNQFVCRICQTRWEKQTPAQDTDKTRAALTKISQSD